MPRSARQVVEAWSAAFNQQDADALAALYAPSGRGFCLPGCGFFQVRNARIVCQRGYGDRATWFRQIGIPV